MTEGRKMTDEEIEEQRARNFDMLGNALLEGADILYERTGHAFAAFIMIDAEGKVAVYQRTGGPAVIAGLRELADNLEREERDGIAWQPADEDFVVQDLRSE